MCILFFFHDYDIFLSYFFIYCPFALHYKGLQVFLQQQLFILAFLPSVQVVILQMHSQSPCIYFLPNSIFISSNFFFNFRLFSVYTRLFFPLNIFLQFCRNCVFFILLRKPKALLIFFFPEFHPKVLALIDFLPFIFLDGIVFPLLCSIFLQAF